MANAQANVVQCESSIMETQNEGTSFKELDFTKKSSGRIVKLRNKPRPYWLFALDVEARIGPVGLEDAKLLWPTLPQVYKQQYKSEAQRMSLNGHNEYYPDCMRLNGVLQLQSCFDRAFARMDSEHALGIGTNMSDIDHVTDIMNTWKL